MFKINICVINNKYDNNNHNHNNNTNNIVLHLRHNLIVAEKMNP